MSVNHPSPCLLVFEKGVDDSARRTLRERDKPIQIVLPSKDDYEDAPYLLAKAVNLLSVLESVSFSEIVNAFAERLLGTRRFANETRINAFVPAS
jgi:hypothetical protein